MMRTQRRTLMSLAGLFAVGVGLHVPFAWTESLEVANPERTKTVVEKQVKQMVHETAQRDPELARELERQKDLVIRELKRGRLDDEGLTREIEMSREIQREVSGRVAQATDGPAHFEQVYKATLARDPQEAAAIKEAFERVSRGELVHPTTPAMMERMLVETERFVAENPDEAVYARGFARREFERFQRELDERHLAVKSSGEASTTPEQIQITAGGHRPQEIARVHVLTVPETSGARNTLGGQSPQESIHLREMMSREKGRMLDPRDVERMREAPTRQVERAREAPVREIERVREAPTRDIERVREAPIRERERVREAPTVERSTERSRASHDNAREQRLERKERPSHKHP